MRAKPTKPRDRIGQVFGLLTIIEYIESRNGRAYYRCSCTCGKDIVVSHPQLEKGRTISCGCTRRPKIVPVWKVCSVCKKEKFTEDNFYFNKNGTINSGCKDCRRKETTEYRKTHPETTRRVDRHRRRLQERFTRHGITKDIFDNIFESQGSCCAICKSTVPFGPWNSWSIDHDHACCPGPNSCGGCIRGILCSWCNPGLGHFKDNKQFLINALQYLEDYEQFKHRPAA